MARILDVPQASRDSHDGQADPEQIKEAMEVPVVGGRVEM